MRKLATVLSLLVLCVGSASAQWNLAQDPAATLAEQTVAVYGAQSTSTGVNVYLRTDRDNISDEIAIWRTGTGTTAYTVSDISTFDATLVNMPSELATEAQCKAAVLKGLANGKQIRPASSVARTKVWFLDNGSARSMNFEIRWDAAGATTLTRLPDDVVTGAVQ